MSLYVLATPIGHPKDITLRGIEYLERAEVVIGEERREVEKLLKKLKLQNNPQIELLNEHSKPQDILALGQLCQKKMVVLVSDCGTPGFQDPGAELVQLCRKSKVLVEPLPGPSSLTTLLSVLGHRLPQFFFAGFLPVKAEAREQAYQQLQSLQQGILLMDTPYRLKKTLEEVARYFPSSHCVLGLNMTQADQTYLEGSASQILKNLSLEKAEFMLALLPQHHQ